jgi:hypothetical protein
MRSSSRAALAAAVGSALLVGILSAPAAGATQGRIAVVNGRPGSNVEVCLNGKEVKSSLRYGQHSAHKANPGSKALKFRKSSRGTCKGDALGQTTIALVAGGDWVVVLTKLSPNKVAKWDNTPFPGPVTVVRHAADIGPAGFKYAVASDETPWFPTADAPFTKGQSGHGGNVEGGGLVFWAHQPPAQTPITVPVSVVHQDGSREELILIGTSLSNVRLKFLRLPNLPV